MTSFSPITERFILHNDIVNKIKNTPYQFGFNALGLIVYQRTYSRLMSDGTKESWPDTVIRVIQGLFSILKDHYIKNNIVFNDIDYYQQAEDMAIAMMQFKFLPPGRGLYACGSKQVYERGGAACNNCAAVQLDDLGSDCEWIISMLMSGTGVGIRLDWDGQINQSQSSDSINIIIDDSREGWASSTKILIDSYVNGTAKPVFDYSKIRPKGAVLETSGGIAPGPGPLILLHKRINVYLKTYHMYKFDNKQNYWQYHLEHVFDVEHTSDNIFYDKEGKIINKQTFVDLGLKHQQLKVYDHIRCQADISNAIGACVVAGGIRRSSLILLCKMDKTFLQLKNYQINPEREFTMGWASNNSIIVDKPLNDVELEIIASGMANNGEPGIFNLTNVPYGRLNQQNKIGREAELDQANVSNPCITNDSLILTNKGLKLVKDLVNKSFVAIVNSKQYKSTNTGFWSTGVKDIIKLNLENGMNIKCTKNHKICIDNNMTFIEAQNLDVGSYVATSRDGKESKLVKIKSIISMDKQEVYDCTIDTVHCFYANGILVHNCAEICIESYELCNLAEIFISKCVDLADFLKMVKFATFYTHVISLVMTHSIKTNEVVARNRRTGVSLSGIAECYDKMNKTEFISWLDQGYALVRSENKRLSTIAKVPESIRVTTTKPAGTISLLAGTNSGMHWPLFNYAIRRVRIQDTSPLVKELTNQGYKIEKDVYSQNTLVVEIPTKFEGRESSLVSLKQQLELLAILQQHWSDNMVSVSLYYQAERDGDLLPLLKQYLPKIKSLSVFPVKDEKIYAQAPNEKIDLDTYNKLNQMLKVNKIKSTDNSSSDGEEPLFCTNDSCVVVVPI